VRKLLALLALVLVALVTVAAAPVLADGGNGGGDEAHHGDNNGGNDNGDDAFTCNGAYAAVTINSDVVVPPNGVCALNGSTVNGSVEVLKNAYFESVITTVKEDVEGHRAQTIYVHDNSSVGGDLVSSRTAQMFVFDSTIGGGIGVDRSTDKVNVCGNTVNGAGIGVVRSGRDILVGDPDVGCGGNTVSKGNVLIAHSNTDVELVVRGNSVPNGSMFVLDNKGPSDKFVQANNGGETLKCKGNESPFVGGPNGTWQSKQRQCF
jgi:hypothetical protein